MTIQFNSITTQNDHQIWLKSIRKDISDRIPQFILYRMTKNEIDWLIEYWTPEVQTRIEAYLDLIDSELKTEGLKWVTRYEVEAQY
jgi:hypothetical protein